MAKNEPQSYASHRKFVPQHHFLASLILVVNLLWALWKLGKALLSDQIPLTFDAVLAALVAFALLLVWYYARDFALKVQDRVIRLEMRLRLERILPDELKGKLDELRRDQVIGLRFAGDGELPDLMREALDDGLGGEQIKKRIKDWRADDWRC
ncbi:MAG: hypothetical protein GY946_24380 [bacterium]|nr:hypothetical protein [bacterium]